MASTGFNEAFLAQCTNPDGNCFASDPGTFEYLSGSGDMGIQASRHQILKAAIGAGLGSTPFEEATYAEGEISEDGGRMLRGETRLLASLESRSDDAEFRIAKCAYACGKAGLDHCALIGIH